MPPLFLFYNVISPPPPADPNDPGGTPGPGGLVAALLVQNLSGNRSGFGTAVTSAFAEMTVSGGVPPYTYEWLYDSGDAETYAFNSTDIRTKFGRMFETTPGSATSYWRGRVKDSVNSVATTERLTVRLTATRATGLGANTQPDYL